MGSSAKNEYCAFTKAIEHLGDRWSLLIVRELYMFGPQGFNTLVAGLPGHVSRSVLSAKLRKLEELGLVLRDGGDGRTTPYRLAPAGEELMPTLKSLWRWAERWVPEDRAMADRDPTVIAYWLMRRVRREALPDRQAVVEIAMGGRPPLRAWLLLERSAEPELCAEDPMLDDGRYVYLEADADKLLAVARGERGVAGAIADRSIEVFGAPELRDALPSWFMPSEDEQARGLAPAISA